MGKVSITREKDRRRRHWNGEGTGGILRAGAGNHAQAPGKSWALAPRRITRSAREIMHHGKSGARTSKLWKFRRGNQGASGKSLELLRRSRHSLLGVDKFLLMSVIFATVLLPRWTARVPSYRHGLKQTIQLMLLFNLAYMIAILYLWPRLLWSG